MFSRRWQIANVPPLCLHFSVLTQIIAAVPDRSNLKKIVLVVSLIAGWTLTSGCGTTTNRVATEQLLISNAIDEAVAQIDFTQIGGNKVYLDTRYLKADKKSGLVNTNYVISSLRQQLTAANCQIHDSQDQADIIVEPRIGAMGTDGHKITYGIPKTGGLSAAASAFAGSPIASIPEISLAQSDAQSGIAKIVVFAYQSTTRQPVWQSGTAKAESNSTSTWVLGAGPFQKGTVYESTRFAGREITPVGHGNVLRSGLIRNSSSIANKKSSGENNRIGTVRYDAAHVFPALPPHPFHGDEMADVKSKSDPAVQPNDTSETGETKVRQASFQH